MHVSMRLPLPSGSDFSLSHACDTLNPTSFVSVVHLVHLWPRGGKVASRLVCSSLDRIGPG